MSTGLKPHPAIEAMDVRTALQRLLEWPNPNPNGTIEQAYVPMWLAASCRAALAAAPAGGAEPVALTDERIDAIAEIVVKGMPDGIQGFLKSWGWRQFARAILEDCAGHYAAPTAQPQPAELKRYEPIVVIDESRGRLTASGAAMEAKFDGRWIRYSDVFPAPSQPTLLNGLTEQETAASASVAGLSGAQPEAPAEPSQDYLPQTWVTAVAKECGVTAARLAFLFDFAERIQRATRLATPAPVAQQPAELTDAKDAARYRHILRWDHEDANGLDSFDDFKARRDARIDASILKAQGGGQ